MTVHRVSQYGSICIWGYTCLWEVRRDDPELPHKERRQSHTDSEYPYPLLSIGILPGESEISGGLDLTPAAM